ncbi:unnamed protein product [Choristocarpus tenellus]
MDASSQHSMAPALGIPPIQHYDSQDRDDALLRLEWTKLLFCAGYRLRYTQETTSTSIVLFHRFLILERVTKYQSSRDLILTTCLFLAGKVTEAPRRLRDVINVLHMLTSQNKDQPPPLDQAYWSKKEKIVEFEQVLLRTINFQLDVPDPYRLLLNYARSLRCSPPVVRTAWGLLNDTLFCPRVLTAPPQTLVCAALYLSACLHSDRKRLREFSVAVKERTIEENGKTEGAGISMDGGSGPSPGTEVELGASALIETQRQDPAVVNRLMLEPVSTCGGGEAGFASWTSERDGKVVDASGRESGGTGKGKKGEEGAQPWWRMFDARDDDVEFVCSELLDLYEDATLRRLVRDQPSP